MKKDVVKYENRMNDFPLKNFRAVDLDMFMLVCSKVKEHQNELLSFSFAELKKAVGMTNKSNKEFLGDLNHMAKQLRKLGGDYLDDIQFFDYGLFSDFYGTLVDVTADNERTAKAYDIYGEVPKNTLLVSVNPRYSFLLNEMKQYTKFDLIDFVKLESKYSKSLFKLLKQYRSSGEYEVGAKKFRELMDCPEWYPNSEFMRVCVNVAVRELSRGYFKDLKVTPVRGPGRGLPIVAYKFTFKKSKDVAGQYRLDDYDENGKLKELKPAARAKNTTKKKTGFANFEQRTYNYEKLEQQLLEAQNQTVDQEGGSDEERP